MSGDIEINPGPLSDQSDSTSDSYNNLLSNGLSITLHLNIQILRPKIDIDLLSVQAEQYDILVFRETWLSSKVSNSDLIIPNFCPPFRCDRPDRTGGGVTIYVKNSIQPPTL